MNFTVDDLDLSVIPFGRSLSRYMIYKEGPTKKRADKGRLAVSLTSCAGQSALLHILPGSEGEDISCECKASPDQLRLFYSGGCARFAIGDTQVLRISANAALRLVSAPYTGAREREDGCFEIEYDCGDRLTFAAIEGSMARSGDSTLVFEPDRETGLFEAAIHESKEPCLRFESYIPFDECAQDALEDYNEWLARYGECFPEYEETRRLAAYLVWLGVHKADEGNSDSYLKNHVIYGRLVGDCKAEAWEQPLHAMAMIIDEGATEYYTFNMFAYQREDGLIPSSCNESGAIWNGVQPPLYGLLLMLAAHTGNDATTSYAPLSRYTKWWLENRFSQKVGLPYYLPGESCAPLSDETDSDGSPLCTPDAATLMLLVTEMLGKTAAAAGKPEEAELWTGLRQRIYGALMSRLWDGEMFCARNSVTGSRVDSDSAAMLLPIVMGGRLPERAVDKLAAQISKRFVPGLGVECKPGSGIAFLPHQVFLSAGLYSNKKLQISQKIARTAFERAKKYGFVLTADKNAAFSSEWETAAAGGLMSLVNML